MSDRIHIDPATLDREVRAEARARFVKRLLICAAVALTLFAIIAFGMLLTAVHNTQIDGTPTGKKLLRASDRIISCTSTTGECTRRNQRQTAALIAGLVRDNRAAAASAASCAGQPSIARIADTDERTVAILTCMSHFTQAKGR